MAQTPLDETVQGKVAEITSALKGAGVTAHGEPTHAHEMARNKRQVEEGLASGDYFPVKPSHATNYDALEKEVRDLGFSPSRIVMDTAQSKVPNIKPLSVGKGETVIVVNEAALKTTPDFVTDFTDFQIQQKRLIELNPSLAVNYNELAQTPAGYSKPARVVLDDTDLGPARKSVKEGASGEPIVMVNRNAHEWTPEFVRQYEQFHDQDIPQYFAEGSLKDVSHKGIAPEVYKAMAESADKRGLTKNGQEVPSIYLDSTNTDSIPFAAAEITDNGKRIVRVNQPFLASPKPFQEAQMEHELAHYERGHSTAENMAAVHNEVVRTRDDPLSRSNEAEADKIGVCHAPDPVKTAQNLSQAYQNVYDINAQKLKKDIPELSPSDIRGLINSEPSHPPLTQRIQDILHYPEHCDIPPPPVTPAAPKDPAARDKNH